MTIISAPLNTLSYYKTGGRCQLLYAPESIEQLSEAMEEISSKGLPWFPLGAGTNSLLSDEKWPGAVVSFHRMQECERVGQTIRCQAGVDNSQLSALAANHGLMGLAWMYRLPGQIGATVRMNARCYGGEISQVVTTVKTVTPHGRIKTYRHTEGERYIFRGYKNTCFMENKELVAEVILHLKEGGDPDALWLKMRSYEADREKKQQFLHPTCGCVFKNDYSSQVSVSSGYLLQQACPKGMRYKGAELSPYHSNFVYNKGASSREILELTFQMREAVFKKFGVWLEYEMEVLGQLPRDLEERYKETRPSQYNDQLVQARRDFHASLSST